MHISNYVNEADVSAALRLYVERRLRFALSRYGSRVGNLAVRIGRDGPSGAYCRISVDVLPFGRVSVNEHDTDLFNAVDRATGRIGRVFGRELERVRDMRVGRETIREAA